MSAIDINDLQRRLSNLVRIGTIGELSGNAATVVIEGDDGVQNTTDPRPWLSGRAGPDADWHAPEPGEQVVLLSPDGNMSNGLILPGLYSTQFPAPADSADVWRKKFKDGTIIEYDRAGHKLTVNLGEGSALVIAKDVIVDALNTTTTGNLTVEKNLTVQGVSALNGGAEVIRSDRG
jgi:phage baseplate assembly protein V